MTAKRDFTDRFLKSLKPAKPGKRYIEYDAQVPGFGIRVTERCRDEDKGSFVLSTRWPGSNNPTARLIGAYPAMPLMRARQIAREWREDLRQGVDPKTKEEARRHAEDKRRADTFAAVFESYAQEHLSTLRTGAVVKRQIEVHVFPIWGERPVSDIKRADYKVLVKGLSRDIPIGANRIDAYLKRFFRWAVDEELIEETPAASVRRPSKEIKRDRALADWEVRSIWQATAELGAFGRAFRFMLATGQRRSEVGGMSWREVDRSGKVWTIPRERTKADRAHEIPLSELALSIIDEQPKIGAFIFSSGRSGTASGSPVAISGWSKAKSALDKLALVKALELAEERGEETPTDIAEWRLHDLRRTAATNLARLGVDRVVIGKVLNHAEQEVTAVYDRHRYDAEKRRALDLWGQRLLAIVNGKTEENVVSLASARGL